MEPNLSPVSSFCPKALCPKRAKAEPEQAADSGVLRIKLSRKQGMDTEALWSLTTPAGTYLGRSAEDKRNRLPFR